MCCSSMVVQVEPQMHLWVTQSGIALIKCVVGGDLSECFFFYRALTSKRVEKEEKQECFMSLT